MLAFQDYTLLLDLLAFQDYNLPICSLLKITIYRSGRFSRLQFTAHCWICSLFNSLLDLLAFQITIYRCLTESARFSNYNLPLTDGSTRFSRYNLPNLLAFQFIVGSARFSGYNLPHLLAFEITIHHICSLFRVTMWV